MASYYIALALRFGQLGITGDETRIGNYVILTLMLLVTFLNFTVHRNRGFMKRTGIQEFEVVLSYNIWLLVGIAVMVVALHVQPSPSRLMLRYFVLIDVAVMMIMRAIAKAARALQSKGAPFYSQERLGLGRKHFRLLKFRSMVADANDVEKYFTPEQLREWQIERKVDNDPRVTGIGRILCKTSLDEFPQFINVLRGDMSIVGPRPIVDEEIVHYGDRASGFLSCKPGITGWWQVEARNDADYASGRRQSLELYYVRHASATLDWNIFKRTFGAVFHGTGK